MPYLATLCAVMVFPLGMLERRRRAWRRGRRLEQHTWWLTAHWRAAGLAPVAIVIAVRLLTGDPSALEIALFALFVGQAGAFWVLLRRQQRVEGGAAK